MKKHIILLLGLVAALTLGASGIRTHLERAHGRWVFDSSETAQLMGLGPGFGSLVAKEFLFGRFEGIQWDIDAREKRLIETLGEEREYNRFSVLADTKERAILDINNMEYVISLEVKDDDVMHVACLGKDCLTLVWRRLK